MLVAPDQAVQTARLLRFLMLGERLAHDCARAQAALVTEPAMHRFFLTQARQEGFHTKVFHQGILWLTPKGTRHAPPLAPMNRYRMLIEKALHNGELADTLLAQQVILERMGEVILERISDGMTRRGLGFTRLRRVVLHQEHAHHAFGLRCLKQLVAADSALLERLRERSAEYFLLIDSMLEEQSDLFAFFDEDPTIYVADACRDLPQWIVGDR